MNRKRINIVYEYYEYHEYNSTRNKSIFNIVMKLL